jgi:hypothetical protein
MGEADETERGVFSDDIGGRSAAEPIGKKKAAGAAFL